MKRLLCIVSSMNRGGAETFLMKLYRTLDTTKYQMDFCVSNPKKGFYDNEIKQRGGKIFLIPQKSKNPIKSFIAIIKIVKKYDYKYVLRTSQQSLATIDLIAAKIGGAKKLIYRSSNANIAGSKLNKIVNKIFSFLPKIVPNVKLAPSTEAAKFVFGEKAVNNNVIIMHNGLDYEQFRFNALTREKIRKELKVDGRFLFGHVGRFNVQKNHTFLLEVFNEIHKKNENTELVLIGEGELREDIEKKIKDLNLQDCVKILEAKANINEYLMAMDLLIFPSLFEGMPNVVIEAQATGLPCIVSDSITKEANITGIVKYVSLDEGAEKWAKYIMEKMELNRRDYYRSFVEKKYCIGDVCEIACKIFFDDN